MRQPIKIRLGGTDYPIRPLTLGQVEAVETALLAKDKGNVARASAIVRAALERDHANVAACLEKIETDLAEVTTAMADVLALCGVKPDPGEAGAAAPNASNGGTSAAA